MENDDNGSSYLTAKQLAVHYAKSEQTIWRWRREEKIPAPVKIHGSTLWRKSDIEDFDRSLQGLQGSDRATAQSEKHKVKSEVHDSRAARESLQEPDDYDNWEARYADLWRYKEDGWTLTKWLPSDQIESKIESVTATASEETVTTLVDLLDAQAFLMGKEAGLIAVKLPDQKTARRFVSDQDRSLAYRTPCASEYHFFAYPEQLEIPNKLLLDGGVECLGDGALVLAPCYFAPDLEWISYKTDRDGWPVIPTKLLSEIRKELESDTIL